MGRRTSIRHLSATQLELLKLQMTNVISNLSRQQKSDAGDLSYNAAHRVTDAGDPPMWDIRV